jgi:imidazolonepropionase-like amidohydrolase
MPLSRRDMLIGTWSIGSGLALSVACSRDQKTASPVPAALAVSGAGSAFPSAQPARMAFMNVTVVPMDTERSLAQQTVVVQDGRITAIGPVGTVALPTRTVQVEGTGRYLLPGLADMHVHIVDESHGLLYLANGVTTIRNMSGQPFHLKASGAVERGEWLAPTLHTAGPIMDGSSPQWPNSVVVQSADEAERAVEAQRTAGFTSAKVYDNLSVDAYRGVVNAARRLRMPVVGHVPEAVGLAAALAAKQDSIEHLRGYLSAAGGIVGFSAARLAAVVDQTLAAGTWNCPTLTVLRQIAPLQSKSDRLARRELRYLSHALIAQWLAETADPATGIALVAAEATQQRYATIAGALHAARANLLLGTDSYNPWVVPGFSIHEELAHLVAAGLSPFEALRAGTREAARFLGQEDEFGTVEVGKRADLLLVAGDPLANVANVGRRVGVMARGRWLTETELQSRLEALASVEATLAPPSA